MCEAVWQGCCGLAGSVVCCCWACFGGAVVVAEAPQWLEPATHCVLEAVWQGSVVVWLLVVVVVVVRQ